MSEHSEYVVIADDDGDDVQLFCEAMAAFDPAIRCLVASNGEEALAQLRNQSEQPLFVFLDMNMPVMGGRECLQELRRNVAYNDIPIFIYSTSTLKHDIKQSLKLGATGFINKPSDFNEIKRILKALFTQYITSPDRSGAYPEIDGVIFRN